MIIYNKLINVARVMLSRQLHAAPYTGRNNIIKCMVVITIFGNNYKMFEEIALLNAFYAKTKNFFFYVSPPCARISDIEVIAVNKKNPLREGCR
ncbi:hypothetical protein PUN28_018447 [Cardiocondyla obscurior]|uniref:Uncharacterized protein n=1 Tax=Cardiocondyla obscurior TaxID=286306 RepID=A0AAW2EIA9_9HYME